MRQVRWVRFVALAMVALTAFAGMHGGRAAMTYADAAFQQQWTAGEGITPNFWGPLATARDGQPEAYAEGTYQGKGGTRLVQYFDKARMELTDPTTNTVTNGLLATEMITGRLQTGNNTFETRGPAAIPIAGDPTNSGPTYAQIQTNNAQLLAAAQSAVGTPTTRSLDSSGKLGVFMAGAADTQATIAAYDNTTQHNIPTAFATFRTTAGLLTIGLAISEPFWSNVQVGGKPKDVLIQAFERRVLTYTPSNPNAFKVEFGNIGIQYYVWRYTLSVPTATPTVAPATMTTTPVVTGVATGTATASASPTATGPTGTAIVPMGVTFSSVQGAKPGGTAIVSVQTAPNASCSIQYSGPGGSGAGAALSNKTAGASGFVQWPIAIPTGSNSGTGTVTVSCNGKTASTSVKIG